MRSVRLQAMIKSVGTSAVLIFALLIFYLIAALDHPWWFKLIFAVPPGGLLLAGVVWMLLGGEQSASVEIRQGQNYFAATNINLLGRRAALDVFGRTPLPPPRGLMRGSAADPANVIEAAAELPADVEVTHKPIDVPQGAGQLQ